MSRSIRLTLPRLACSVFVVTFELFLHELRGIMKCNGLIRRGKNLEERLKLHKGQFAMDYEYYRGDGRIVRKVFQQLIGPLGSAWIIYPSECVAWLYVGAVAFEIPIDLFLVFLGVLIAVSALCATVRLLRLRAAGEEKDVDQ